MRPGTLSAAEFQRQLVQFTCSAIYIFFFSMEVVVHLFDQANGCLSPPFPFQFSDRLSAIEQWIRDKYDRKLFLPRDAPAQAPERVPDRSVLSCLVTYHSRFSLEEEEGKGSQSWSCCPDRKWIRVQPSAYSPANSHRSGSAGSCATSLIVLSTCV